MTNIYDLFATNTEDAENGKWFEFGDTISIKIRRFKSRKSRRVREDLEAPYKRTTKLGGSLPDAVAQSIANAHVANGLIADWKGVTNRAGDAIPFTPAAALSLVEELPELRDSIIEISLSLDSFREEAKDAIVGN